MVSNLHLSPHTHTHTHKIFFLSWKCSYIFTFKNPHFFPQKSTIHNPCFSNKTLTHLCTNKFFSIQIQKKNKFLQRWPAHFNKEIYFYPQQTFFKKKKIFFPTTPQSTFSYSLFVYCLPNFKNPLYHSKKKEESTTKNFSTNKKKNWKWPTKTSLNW